MIKVNCTVIAASLPHLTCGFFLIKPSVGTKSPVNSLMSVDFPAPLGPTRAIRESKSKPKSRSWDIWKRNHERHITIKRGCISGPVQREGRRESHERLDWTGAAIDGSQNTTGKQMGKRKRPQQATERQLHSVQHTGPGWPPIEENFLVQHLPPLITIYSSICTEWLCVLFSLIMSLHYKITSG